MSGAVSIVRRSLSSLTAIFAARLVFFFFFGFEPPIRQHARRPRQRQSAARPSRSQIEAPLLPDRDVGAAVVTGIDATVGEVASTAGTAAAAVVVAVVVLLVVAVVG